MECEDNDGEGTPGWEDWYDDETNSDDPVAYVKSMILKNTLGDVA